MSDQFDFIGSDGGFLELEPDQERMIVEHQIAWARAKQTMAIAKFARAVDQFVAAVQSEFVPILERFALEVAKVVEKLALHLPSAGDLKAVERARSKADVKAKRREMMKRRGRK